MLVQSGASCLFGSRILAIRRGDVMNGHVSSTTCGDFAWRGIVDVASIRIWLRHPVL